MSAKPKPIHEDDAPPLCNVEMERALLGSLLVDNEVFDRVQGVLEPEHFYESAHGRIYEVCADLIEKQMPANLLTLKNCFADVDFAGLQPVQYLARLVAESTHMINALPYANALADLAQKRRVLSICDQIKEHVLKSSSQVGAKDLVAEANGMLDEVFFKNGVPSGFVMFGEALQQSIKNSAKAYETGGAAGSVSTGIQELDKALGGGFSPTDLVILAGRPGMGKSALASNVLKNITEQHPNKIGVFFSLEMSAEQIAKRELSKESGMSMSRMRCGNFTQEEFEKLTEKTDGMKGLKLAIQETPGLKMSQINSMLRGLSRRHPISLVVVDYLQLLEASGKSKGRGDNRVGELTEITRALKTLAKEFKVPVLALSQLSRQVESRDDKRPILSDLRESGSIEQDADIVMFVYREEYYIKGQEPKNKNSDAWEGWRSDMERWAGISEIIIGKNRHGSTTSCMLGFNGETTSFRDLEQDELNRSSNRPMTKVRLTNAASRTSWDAIAKALDRLGQVGRAACVPEGLKAATYQECVGEMLAGMPSLDGDDTEKVEKQARLKFREGVIWLKEERAINLVVEEINGFKDAWIWLGSRGVRR